MMNILIVDDQEVNLKVLELLLKKEDYNVTSAVSAQDALDIILNSPDDYFDIILSDINMPTMSGFELCNILKTDEIYSEKCKDTPIIFISALTSIDDIEKGFESGAVDYITKPFNAKEVRLRVQNHLKIRIMQHQLKDYSETLEQKVKMQVAQLARTQMATIFSLAKLAQSRDDDTGRHLERVQVFCKLLSEELRKMPEFQDKITDEFIEDIFQASPLHDIGKVGISDLILLKHGKLTEEEFEVMKTHTQIGAKTLEEVNHRFQGNSFIETGILIARYHHERYDGSGYPVGLSGEEIPLCARIMSIADVYDALKTKRSYKEEFPHEKCVQIIKEGSGTQFDPKLVEAFLNISDKFYETWEYYQNTLDDDYEDIITEIHL